MVEFQLIQNAPDINFEEKAENFSVSARREWFFFELLFLLLFSCRIFCFVGVSHVLNVHLRESTCAFVIVRARKQNKPNENSMRVRKRKREMKKNARKSRHNCILLKTKYIHIKIVGKQMNILFKLCEFCQCSR